MCDPQAAAVADAALTTPSVHHPLSEQAAQRTQEPCGAQGSAQTASSAWHPHLPVWATRLGTAQVMALAAAAAVRVWCEQGLLLVYRSQPARTTQHHFVAMHAWQTEQTVSARYRLAEQRSVTEAGPADEQAPASGWRSVTACSP
jgi:hypothetical protein